MFKDFLATYKKYRHIRTPILAVFACITFVAAAILSFDVDPDELIEFLIASVIGLFIIITAAWICAYILQKFRS